MQIRAEFRLMWLSTHKIPLSLVTTYLKVFFPIRLPKIPSFKPLALNAPNLRVFIRRDDMDSDHLDDVTRLLKHKARFPASVITCHSLPYYDGKVLRALERVINHSNVAWLQALSKGKFSQVRLGIHTTTSTWDGHKSQVAVDIVVKERFAEPWMKPTLKAPPAGDLDRFLERIGFAPDSIAWRVKVNVDYS